MTAPQTSMEGAAVPSMDPASPGQMDVRPSVGATPSEAYRAYESMLAGWNHLEEVIGLTNVDCDTARELRDRI